MNKLAKRLNADGQTYCGEKAVGFEKNGLSRIYFGVNYVTIIDGKATNRVPSAWGKSIGNSAVELVEQYLNKEDRQ